MATTSGRAGQLTEWRPKCTAAPTNQWGSKKVSTESLPKTGILRKLVGDFLGLLAEVAEIRDLETQRRLQENPHIAGFSLFFCELS